MAMEVVDLYITHISSFFGLPDSATLDLTAKYSEDPGAGQTLPSFVPVGTTVLTACHFAEKLVEEVNESIADLMGVDIGGEAGKALRAMLQSLRTRLLLVISDTWARGERLLTHWRP